jgi:DHA1 family bicyclomycin/chloramphenicol resistance-like MFS transporter
LAVLTMIGPLAVDLYLPALPEIGRELGAPTASVQLTISSYLVGFAVGQIAYGPISDIHGRRRILLIALAIFCVATLLCAYAPTIELLIAARICQALGASGAIVLARAVVRDLYSGARAGRELSVMGMMMAVAPAIAPTIGGVVQAAFGWRACFLSVLAAGLCAFAAVWFLLPETLRQRPQSAFAVGDLVRGCGMVMRHRGFRAHLVLLASVHAGLFAYISGASFVLQEMLGLTPIEFALTFALTSIGLVGGASLAAHMVMRLGIDRMLGLGTGALAAGGLAMVVTTYLVPTSAFGLVVPMALYMVGLGMMMPQALAGALQPFPHHAGTASSLAGFMQQCTAALAGAVVGHLLGVTAWPMVIVIAASGCVTLIAWWWSRGVRAQA